MASLLEDMCRKPCKRIGRAKVDPSIRKMAIDLGRRRMSWRSPFKEVVLRPGDTDRPRRIGADKIAAYHAAHSRAAARDGGAPRTPLHRAPPWPIAIARPLQAV